MSPGIRVYAPGGDPNSTGAKQSFKDECDINRIMDTYKTTGIMPHQRKDKPRFGFAPDVDFRQALDLVTSAQEQFLELPAEVRAEFENDPGKFLEFIQDDENRKQAEELGLIGSPESVSSPDPEGESNADPGVTAPGEDSPETPENT